MNKHKSCTSSQRQEDKFIFKKVDCKKLKYKDTIIVMANTQGSILHTKQGVHEHSACRHNTNTQVTQGIREVIVPSPTIRNAS